MKFMKKIVVALTSAVMVSCMPFSAYAITEEELEIMDEQLAQENAPEESYIESGDYKYSLQIYDDGEEVAFLEEYIGSDAEVEIPEEIDGYTVRGLGDRTFYENEEITKIIIPETLWDFGNFPFYGCTSLMEFVVDKDHEIYMADGDGALVGKDGMAIMAYPTGKNPETYTVPDGVVAINSSAFAMCTNLKEITFPESLVFLGNFAFSECTSIEKIEIPDQVTAIGNFTFSTCTSLTDIKLPVNLQKIGNASFYKCESLEMIDFPETLTEIGQAAFCSTGITSILIPPTISAIGYSAFGFYTDENDQIVLDSNFVIKGYTNTYAQTYCTENGINFISLDDELVPIEENEEEKVNVGLIAGICIVVAVAVIGTVVLIVKKKSKKDNDADGESNSDENVEEEE